MKRVAVIATLAVACVLLLAIGAWRWYAASIGSLQEAQVSAARSMLASSGLSAQVMVDALLRPGLHIIVQDERTGEVADTYPRPRDAGPPSGAPPGAPPPAGMGRPNAPISQFAGQLSGLRPVRIDTPAFSVVVAPDVVKLGIFLQWDIVLALIAIAAIAVFAVGTSAAQTRRERAHLHAIAEERRAAATEFQRFLADAGHELRTPLTIVSGYVDILSARSDETDERMRRLFEGMRAETARMRALVEKMLLLARLETPVAVPRLIDIASVARDAADAMHARFPERAIAFENGAAAPIVIDQDDLYEAMHNLIENALKYAPESPVTVETGIRDGRAFASVRDRGPGIPASEREAIFRRFYRGNGRSDSEGSGLGLAIVARVADRWDGRIDLQSGPGETSFTLSFPLADEEPHVIATR